MPNNQCAALPTPPPSRGKTGKRHRMRCSKCGGRFTLKRHPDTYRRAVKCPVTTCKSLHVYSCEASRRRELKRQNTCYCSAYPFPHRSGSLLFCRENPAWENGFDPSDEDIECYHKTLDTPRSRYC